jgi:hypothetical protein
LDRFRDPSRGNYDFLFADSLQADGLGMTEKHLDKKLKVVDITSENLIEKT